MYIPLHDTPTSVTNYVLMCTYADNAALFTTVVVASYMRRIFFGLTNQSISGPMNLSLANYAFIWVLPAILSALPFTTRHYGRNEDDIFCWIKGGRSGDDNDRVHDFFSFFWQAVVVGLPAGIGISYNFWVYFKILQSIRTWSNVSEATPFSICNFVVKFDLHE